MEDDRSLPIDEQAVYPWTGQCSESAIRYPADRGATSRPVRSPWPTPTATGPLARTAAGSINPFDRVRLTHAQRSAL